MAKNEAKVKFTAETGEFNDQIKRANLEMQNLRAEMRLNEAQFKNTGDSTSKFEKNSDLLNKQLEQNKQKQEALNSKLEVAKSIYGEDSDEVLKLEKQLANTKTEEERLSLALSNTQKEYDKYNRSAEESETAVGKLTNIIDDQTKELEELQKELANAYIEYGKDSNEVEELKRDISDLSSELGENKNALKEAEDAAKEAASSFKDMGESSDAGWSVLGQVSADLITSGLENAGQAVKDFAHESVEAGKEFGATMSEVEAVSGANGDEIRALTDKAKEFGRTTSFSASEVAKGMTYMGMAGWDASQMLGGGLEGIIKLSEASGTDLAKASDIVTDSLTAFGEGAEEAGRLADIMAATSSSANTNVEMMGETFKYAAPVAGALGYSMEDVSLATGLMANAGIKASSAGTTLRTLMSNMANPTDKMSTAMDVLGVSLDDGQGNMKSFREVMTDMRNGFGELKISQDEYDKSVADLDAGLADGTLSQKEYDKGMSDLIERAYGAEGAQKAMYASMLAGKTGLSGLMAIVNASDEDFNSLAESIDGSKGSAEEMAAIKMDNLDGDMKLMESATEGLKLALFDCVDGPLRSFAQLNANTIIPGITKVVTGISGFVGKSTLAKTILVILAASATAFAIALAAIGVKLLIVSGIQKLSAVMTVLNGTFLANPITLVVIGLVGLAAGFAYAYKHSEKFRTICNKVFGFLKIVGVGAFMVITARIRMVITVIKIVSSAFGIVPSSIQKHLTSAINKVKSFVDRIKNFFKNLILKIPAPHLPALPHFTLDKASKTIFGKTIEYPTGVSVKWYASAMDNPVIVGRPSIIDGHGVGEAGSEMIGGVNTVSRMIQNSVTNAVRFDYVAMANATAYAIAALNLKVEIDKREFGRLVASV